jgi:uroporphyrinogen-III synthase
MSYVPANSDGPRVLITRSEPGAGALASKLRAAGYQPVVAPLIGIEPCGGRQEASEIAGLDRCAVAVFLSVHAVAYGLARITRHWPQLPEDLVWIAVGGATAAALAAHGIVARAPMDERSEGILALPELTGVAGQRVLLVGGEGGRRWLDQALRERGADVHRIEVYRRVRSAAATAELARARFDYIVVASIAGGEALAEIAPPTHDAILVVPSRRVAEAVTALGFERVIESAGAGPAAVLSAIEEHGDSDE